MRSRFDHRLWPLVGLVLIFSCGPDGTADRVRTATAMLSGVVPASDTCNAGVNRSECFYAPLVNEAAGDTSPRFVVDGQRGERECHQVARVPYVDSAKRATGTIHLAAVSLPNRLRPFFDPRDTLFAYLEDLPVYPEVAAPPGIVPGVVTLIVDHERFTGASPCYDSRDRFFVINLFAREIHEMRIRPGSPPCGAVRFEEVPTAALRRGRRDGGGQTTRTASARAAPRA